MASKQVFNLQELGAITYHRALQAINSTTRLSKIRKMKMIQQLKKLQRPNKSTLQSIRNSFRKSPRKSPRNNTHKSPKK